MTVLGMHPAITSSSGESVGNREENRKCQIMGKKVSIGTDNLAIYWSLHDVLIFSFYILLKTSSETEHEFTAVFSNSLHSGHILCAGTICRTDTSSEPSLRQGEVFEHTPASAAGSPH